jgi:hypothetical protein
MMSLEHWYMEKMCSGKQEAEEAGKRWAGFTLS